MEFKYVFLDNYYSLKNNECIFSIRHGLEELEILKKVRVTVVAVATMTFQNGGYFPFKVI